MWNHHSFNYRWDIAPKPTGATAMTTRQLSSSLRPVLTAMVAALLPTLAWAQVYPTKRIRIVVGSSAGGGLDFVARIVGHKLSAALGQPIIIDNRPGAAASPSSGPASCIISPLARASQYGADDIFCAKLEESVMTAKMTAPTLRAPITLFLKAVWPGKPCTAIRWHRWRFIGMALATSAFVATASAQPQQTYPDRPIRFVVPLATGGATDIAARLFGQKLADAFGQQVVIDNRPGAGGLIGAELAAKASPDGYTLMMVSSSHTVLPSLHKKLPYDIVNDFAPVTMLIATPFLLLVHPSVPANSVKDLLALAKAKPGQINYASGGNGSAAHIAAESFKSVTGINVVHLPYKGTAPALIGLLAGEAGLAFYTISATLQHVKAGRLRALATTDEKRSPSLPDLPTVAEAGVPGFEASTWVGVAAPAGTPKSIIAKLHGEFTRILKLPEVKERLAALGFKDKGNTTPEEFGTIIKNEVVRWSKVLKESGAKVD